MGANYIIKGARMKDTLMKIVYILIFILNLIVVSFLIIYITSTKNTNDVFVYFSGDAALKSWISPEDEVVFEYETDNFLIKFDNKSFYVAKKDGLLWVEDNVTSYGDKATIRSTVVKGTVYIYGKVNLIGIEKVILTDTSLRPIECKTESIKTGDNQLIFYIEIPLTDIQGGPMPINFIDKNGNVISYANNDQDMPQMQLINEVLLTLDVVENKLSDKYTDQLVEKTLSQEYYITPEGKVELVKESVAFHFYDEYVLLLKFKTIRGGSKEYITTYNLDYTEELIELKSILSHDMQDD
jgi:hypothetical protein